MRRTKIETKQSRTCAFAFLLFLLTALSVAFNAASAGPFVYVSGVDTGILSVIDSTTNTVTAAMSLVLLCQVYLNFASRMV
jgi:hypothetical protein